MGLRLCLANGNGNGFNWGKTDSINSDSCR